MTTSSNPTDPIDPLDQAVSRRLASLRHVPVDTSHLDRALRSQIGSPDMPAAWRRRFRTLVGVAAGIIVLAIVGLALLQNRSVQASPDVMFQMHRDIVAGKIDTLPVDSFDDVSKAFAAFGQGNVKLDGPPQTHVHACCMPDVGSKRVACILVHDGNTPVTLTIADLDAVKPLPPPAIMRNGEAFYVQSEGKIGTGGELNMVMVDRGHRRICMIGELPVEKLMTLSDTVKF